MIFRLRQVALLAVIGAGVAAPLTRAAEPYFDTAQVIASEPILASGDAGACQRHGPLGDQRRARPGLRLADVLRDAGTPAVTCRHERPAVVGYRVTFRYAGETWTRDMDHDPGDTIRVRVDVRDAGSGSTLISSQR